MVAKEEGEGMQSSLHQVVQRQPPRLKEDLAEVVVELLAATAPAEMLVMAVMPVRRLRVLRRQRRRQLGEMVDRTELLEQRLLATVVMLKRTQLLLLIHHLALPQLHLRLAVAAVAILLPRRAALAVLHRRAR
jgi:hypothetical protein